MLPVNEVESLYYLSWIVDAIASKQAAALGEDPEDLMTAARSNAIASLDAEAIEHLASANAIKMLRSTALASLPSRDEIIALGATLPISLTSPYPGEHEDLFNLVADADFDAIVTRYSVRNSGFLGAVAKSLGYQSIKHYEQAVRVVLSDVAQLRAKLSDTIGDLPGDSV